MFYNDAKKTVYPSVLASANIQTEKILCFKKVIKATLIFPAELNLIQIQVYDGILL